MKRDKVFVDTNVIIDWLGSREPFFDSAKALFLKSEYGEITILVSVMSYMTTEYILRKQIGKQQVQQALMGLRTISTVCTSGIKEIDLLLVSPIKDFENAIQYYTALNNSATVIVTRNQKDFKKSDLPVMNAEQYLRTLK